MPAKKTAAKGAELLLGDGNSPETFTVVSAVKDLSIPLAQADYIDVTTHDSPSNYEEFVAGIIRTGEVSFNGHFDTSDPTHDGTTGLLSIAEGTLRNWRIQFNDAGGLLVAFAGFIRISLSAPVAGSNDFEGSIRISGEIVRL